MARIRTIKPEFWTNSTTGQLSGDATKLYLGLHNHSDDYGVIRYDVAEFRARILPYARSGAVEKALSELEDAGADENPFGLIVIFRVARKRYLWLSYFTKHQKVDKPGPPLINGWTALSTPLEYADSENVRDDSRPFENVLASRARGGEDRRGEERKGEDRIAPRTARTPNTGWDALAEVFGYTPKTKSERTLWGKLSRDLGAADATVETVTEAARRYRAAMPNAELTPPALVKHYERLMAQPNGAGHISEIGAQAQRLLGGAS